MCDVFGPPQFRRPFRRYQIYRKRETLYIFGIDRVNDEYSVLKIRRQENIDDPLTLEEGEDRYRLATMKDEIQKLKSSAGGLEDVAEASGIIGFIRFLQGYYIILITRDKTVGKIGHHYVLSIEKTTLEPLFSEHGSDHRDEKSLREHFYNLNLGKDFYFCYSYDISRTVQQNLADAARFAQGDRRPPLLTETDPRHHHRFLWNHFHMEPFLKNEGWQHWCLGIIHGFFGYSKCSSFGWSFDIALIARRSRFHAGTRYRKRGLNHEGHTANDVETEQVVCDDATRHLSQGNVMSFVQMRGSVPLFWAQEGKHWIPKPDVLYLRCDPTLSATRKHFADLYARYGVPLLVVNLMKAQKESDHECQLGKNYQTAMERINKELPREFKVLYRAFDMKHHSKSKHIDELFNDVSYKAVMRVGFFHNSHGMHFKPERLQTGVVRTNCVDCLDRTNILQFFLGLEALKQQLTTLNLLPEPRLDSQSQVFVVLAELYELMGDHLALQYAGSIAHKKNELLGGRPRMMSSSKELLTSIQRHYNNSFTDSEKQASVNLFLGIYNSREHPRLNEFDSDVWVHHRSLQDEYDPGEWWLDPIATNVKNMSVLDGAELPFLSQIWSRENQQAWFREVHVVGKFTWFEKLLASLDETNLQINRDGQKLATMRTYQISVNRQKTKDEHLETNTRCISRRLSVQPFDVDGSDLKIYTEYVVMKRLSAKFEKLSCLTNTDHTCLTISGAALPLYRPELRGRTLKDLFKSYSWKNDLPIFCTENTNDEALFSFWFLRKYVGLPNLPKHRSDKAATKFPPGSLKKVQSKLPNGQYTSLNEFLGLRDKHPIIRDEAILPKRLHMCSYCNAAYNASEDDRSGIPENHKFDSESLDLKSLCPGLQLCPRHRERMIDIQDLFERKAPEPQITEPKVDETRIGNGIVTFNLKNRDPALKPWESWLKVAPAAPAPTVSLGDVRRGAAGSPPRRGADISIGAIAVDARRCADAECSADKSRRLWSYAFPYMPPPVVEVDKLGVPDWWKASLEDPMPTGQDGSSPLNSRRSNVSRKKAVISRQSPIEKEKGPSLIRTVSGTQGKVPTDFSASKPAVFEDGSKSIFRGANLNKILEAVACETLST